jgi:hypothetical protein
MADGGLDLQQRHNALAATVKGVAKSAELRAAAKAVAGGASSSSSSNSGGSGGGGAGKKAKSALTPNSRLAKHLSSRK